MKVFFLLLFFAMVYVLSPYNVYAVEWTPLISSLDFAGISTDVKASAGGIISIVLIVLGLGILVRILGK